MPSTRKETIAGKGKQGANPLFVHVRYDRLFFMHPDRGMNIWVRIGYACHAEVLKEGLARVSEFMRTLG
ncbi:hypothetical protein [Brevibacillus massiliensis]|uniref:hypothetical protein n=1 Tax=Brevibacillus massiliensis TaxID=1118054 RepID=UPI00164E7C07|nr:hypothetical protein [Brevibacillus massiliensis]